MRLRTELGWNGILLNSGNYFMNKATEQMTKKEWVTPLNINEIMVKYNISKEIDFLSIDIDSNDYWVWKNLDD